MANNWKFYQETLKVGGTANSAERVNYVDSHNGSDVTGTGAYDNPFQTIQASLDTGYAHDIVLAGIFEGAGIAGEWTGGHSNAYSLIAEGTVVFNGDGLASFGIGRYGHNRAYWSGGRKRYGKLIFKSYTCTVDGTTNSQFFDSEYHDCTSVARSGTFYGIADILCVNTTFGRAGVTNLFQTGGLGVSNMTLINSSLNTYRPVEAMKNCYFDSTSILYIPDSAFQILMVNNCFEGSLTNRITYGGGNYSTIEALEAVRPLTVYNNLPSTTVPLLNQVNNLDFTLQESSPLKSAGVGGTQIGYAKVAKAIDASFSGWTGTTNIDNTTTPGEAILNGSPTGTMESEGIELFPKARKVTRINMPDFEFNSPLGEMIGNLSSDNIPYLLDVEIQYSLDNVTYNGTWLRMAVGVQPMHDTTYDVGTDDPLYDITTAEMIVCRYMKFRITLRDNEIQV